MALTPRDYIESLGQSILASLSDIQKTAFCPGCGQQNLTAEIHDRTVVVICKTPARYNEESDLEYCPYHTIINPMDISKGPFTLAFAAEKRLRQPVKQKRSRSTALTSRTRRSRQETG